MSDNKKEQQVEKGLENVEQTLGKTEQFIERNQKSIMIGALAVILVFAIIWMAKILYMEPMAEEAQSNMFNAQYYFEQDSMRLALEGDGMNAGFLQIIEEYGSTPAGNLACYYAGVCYLKTGDYENAKKYFKAFSSDDDMLSSFAEGLYGDAESQLGNNSEAISAYKNAVAKGHTLVAPIYLMKMGALYESMGNSAEAKACYDKVKTLYPRSMQAASAEKYSLSVK